MDSLHNVLDWLLGRPSLVLSSLEEALKDSSIDNAAFSLKKINVTSQLKVEDMRAQGGSADVYMGWLKAKEPKSGPMKVAIKVFRLYVPGAEKVSAVYKPLFSQCLF